jgi:hypothetical protein
VNETLLYVLVFVGVLAVTALVRQIELMLIARGARRAASALAMVRALVPDAPTLARLIVSMRTGRPVLPTLPEIPHPPP